VRRLPPTISAALTLALTVTLAGCGSGSSAPAPSAPPVTGQARDRTTTAYDAATSTPAEDSVYPDIGDPGAAQYRTLGHVGGAHRVEIVQRSRFSGRVPPARGELVEAGDFLGADVGLARLHGADSRLRCAQRTCHS
jgi:hypothetical protein